MKTLSRVLLTTAAVVMIGAGAAIGGNAVRIIDHPNGPPTFVAVPQDQRDANYVVAGYVFDDDSEIAEMIVVRKDREVVPLHRGRGEVIYVPIARVER